MATLHGRGGMLYLQGSGANATKLGEVREWSINIDRATDDDSAMGDTWGTKLTGILTWSGRATGNLDSAETSPFDAATNTSSRRIYLYPDDSATARYYYGTVWPRLSVDASLAGTERFTLDFEGTGQLAAN